MAANKLQWKRIAKGDELPCQSFLRKKNGEILKLSTGAGVTVGQDAYYLPVDDVIEEIRNYPIEESEDEKMRKELFERFSHIKGFDWYGLPIKDILAWLEKQGEQKEYPQSVKDTETSETNNVELTDFEGALFTTFSDMWQDYMLGHEVNVAKAVKEHSAELLEIANRKFLAEWSDHDEDMLNSVKLHLDNAEVDAYFYSWLDNLKDRVLPQPKQEWSEEDERIKNNLLSELTNLSVRKLIKEETKKKYASWLKSLRPQYTWKPSKEQMNTLEYYMHTLVCNEYKEILFGLYADLKKLMEE